MTYGYNDFIHTHYDLVMTYGYNDFIHTFQD